MKDGFGQSNICYVYDDRGKNKNAPWMKKAVSYVLNYDKENLLTNPAAEVESDELTSISQERAAGFQSNSAIRQAIELFAMQRARTELTKMKFGTFQNTSSTKPYDFTCKRDDQEFYVEVKGTQTSGRTIFLTKNEVENVRQNPGYCILVLVHSVKVHGRKTPRVNGGKVEVKENWSLQSQHLQPIQYMWTVS